MQAAVSCGLICGSVEGFTMYFLVNRKLTTQLKRAQGLLVRVSAVSVFQI